MVKEDIQKVVVNRDYLRTAMFSFRAGEVVDRDEDPKKFKQLTKSLSNVGDTDDSVIQVLEYILEDSEEQEEPEPETDSEEEPEEDSE